MFAVNVAKMLRIRTFGGLAIRLNDEPVTGFASRKAEALLVYLACTGRRHAREVLADLLWDDRSQSQAMSNLRAVLSILRKQVGPYVQISRETAGINPEAAIWLDAGALEEGLAALPPIGERASGEALAVAAGVVARYEGEFLEGFHLREARGFEEWATLERERLRLVVLRGLRRLAEHHLQHGDYAAGIPLARQLLRLDPLDEAGHRRLMRLLIKNDQRAAALAQYELCRQLLADELGVQPVAETVLLYEQIRAGTPAPAARRPVASLPAIAELPAFLKEGANAPEPEERLFVARERELARLDGFLAAAVAGQTQVAFVTGEAGAGKTALLIAFARRAAERYPELVSAFGSCNAFSGRGDPYLPFRDVMAMLTGDVENRWRTGIIDREQARRLWALLPLALQAVVAQGPDLVDTILPGRALRARASAALLGPQPLLEQLLDRQREQTMPGNLRQRNLFDQLAATLQALAEKRPLLIMLDDLQWMDSGSIDLLFHLGRRLAQTPVLFLCAYRPEELSAARGEESHPLSPVLNELKRLYGDVWLDLDNTEPAERRALVNGLLDSEPNGLGEDFRLALLGRAGGQPLFTVELLRELQEGGDLVQDERGRWVAGDKMDWHTLPARVEGIIEQRVNQLPAELQAILALAAVEGKQFTAQVIAQVQGLDEGRLIRQLSQLLDRKYRLIGERGSVRVNGRRLALYQFRHQLFQVYLYERLGAAERALAHEEVGNALAGLYGEDAREIAGQLGRHYMEAGLDEQAAEQFLQAGDRARRLYAYREAVEHYRQAIGLLQSQGANARAARALLKLGLTCHLLSDYAHSQQAYDESFALLRRLVAAPVVDRQPAPHPLRVRFLDPLTRDPAHVATNQQGAAISLLFDGLVELDSSMNIIPNLAARWEILDGGHSYRFHLRPDAVWSDGEQLSAHDCEYAWKRVLQPATGARLATLLYDIKGARGLHQGEHADPDQVGVRAQDALTLLVELERPSSHFLHVLCVPVTFPVPRHVLARRAVAQHKEQWTEVGNIVASGPFRLESRLPGRRMQLTRNANYHGHAGGNVQQVTVHVEPDWSTALELYSADQFDVLFTQYLPVGTADGQEHFAGEYFPMITPATTYLAFNVKHAPFDDVRVRQAFALAIEREALGLDEGSGLASGGFVPPGIPGHSPGIALPHDLARARRLLAEAGFAGGRVRRPLLFYAIPHVRAGLAKALQNQWQDKLGVQFAEQAPFTNFADFMTTLASRPPDIFLSIWVADYFDPANFLRDALGIVSSWQDDTYDGYLAEASRQPIPEERIRHYQEADRFLLEKAALVPIKYGPWYQKGILAKPWVTVPPLVMEGPVWKHVVIEPH